VPCFNEARTIASLVTETRPFLSEIIIVDDGSADTTREEAERAGALVVPHARNRGKGAALRTGLTCARQRGFPWAVILDGDGQHRPADIPRFLDCAERAKAQLVIGNRMHKARAIPLARRWVNFWLSARLSRRAGQPLPDTQCGFRLIHLESWAGLRLEADHFEVESEMLVAFLAAGLRVEFVPIEVIGRGPSSHIRPFLDSWRWWKWWRGVPKSGGPSAESTADS